MPKYTFYLLRKFTIIINNFECNNYIFILFLVAIGICIGRSGVVLNLENCQVLNLIRHVLPVGIHRHIK